jgi:hypothetical protein
LDVPETRRANQFGLAFGYDPDLNVVLAASTDHHRDHRVGLWSVETGRLLPKCPLSEYKFEKAVTCAKFVDVRDGPRSILVNDGGRIVEWCAQGRGLEEEE